MGGAGKDTLDGGPAAIRRATRTPSPKSSPTSNRPRATSATPKATSIPHREPHGVRLQRSADRRRCANLISGGIGKDTIAGGKGGDTIAGGKGHDVLKGEAGKDFFLFDVAPNAKNDDVIEGFKPKDDTILLDNAVYIGIAGGAFRAVRSTPA